MTALEISNALGRRAPAWDRLAGAMRSPSPFLRSWWLEGVAGPRAEFVLALDGDELVGGVAVELDRRRGVKRCRLVGSGPLAPHNLDLVALPGRERDVWAAMDEYLERSQPGIVDFFGVDPVSALVACAPPSAQTEEIDEAPRIAVPPDFKIYVDSRARKLRQELRRVERRLLEAGFEYREVEPADTERAVTTFERLHRRMWGSRSHVLVAFDSLLSALRVGAHRGEVVFQEVVAGDRVVASLVAIEVAGVSTWYQMGRDTDPRWANAGTYLKARAVRRSCLLGHSAIDMAIGGSRVKVRWSDSQRPVLRLRWARGLLARVELKGLMTAGHVADSARARRVPEPAGQ